MFGNDFGHSFSEFAEAYLSGRCPEVRKCINKTELGNWFSQFARACRAALPKQEAIK